MRERDLRCLISVLMLSLPGHAVIAEPLDSRGIAAIRTGSVAEVGDFVGTGFHVGNGWFATAKHVIEKIRSTHGDDWHIVLGSKSADGNKLSIYRQPECQESLDFCFFRVDPADSLLTNLDYGESFQPDCIVDADSPPTLEMSGFSDETMSLKEFKSGITILSRDANFVGDDGTRYPWVIVTDAPTSPGMSGSPVLKQGTRNVVGLHTGYSSSTNNQVVSPFYNITGDVQIGGERVFACEMSEAPAPDPDPDGVLLSSEDFSNLLRTCAAGSSITVDANLIGSIETIYQGAQTKGNLKYITSADFLNALPEKDRLAAYTLYNQCIQNLLPDRRTDSSVNDRASSEVASMKAEISDIITDINKTLNIKESELFPAFEAFISDQSEANWKELQSESVRLLNQITEGLEKVEEYNSKLITVDSNVQLISGGIRQLVDRKYANSFVEARKQWDGRKFVTEQISIKKQMPTRDQAEEWYKGLLLLHDELRVELKKCLSLLDEA